MLRMFKTAPGGFSQQRKRKYPKTNFVGNKIERLAFLAGLKGKAQDVLCNWAAPISRACKRRRHALVTPEG